MLSFPCPALLTDARGNSITHTYDSMDRLATRTDPVGAVESFAYDGQGNLIGHTDRKSRLLIHRLISRKESGVTLRLVRILSVSLGGAPGCKDS